MTLDVLENRVKNSECSKAVAQPQSALLGGANKIKILVNGEEKHVVVSSDELHAEVS